MFINQEGKIDHFKKLLSKVQGDIVRSIEVLQEFSDANTIDIFIYVNKSACLYDMLRHNKIPIKFLEDTSQSLLSEAYNTKQSIQSKHLDYDKRFNIPLDNPYKIDMTSQILIPIVQEEQIKGIIRFSKTTLFSKDTFVMLNGFKENFLPLFSRESYEKRINMSEVHFTLEGNKVNNMLATMKKYIEQLHENAKELEIKKLCMRMEDELNSIYQYLDKEEGEKVSPKENIGRNKTRILIADDVEINIKILNAMLQKTSLELEIFSTFDGIETEELLEKLRETDNPIRIILLDHHMPGKLGLDIAKDLRKYENSHKMKHTFLVSITNDPKAIDGNKELFDYQLSKPFSKQAINDTINHIKEFLIREARE